MWFGLVCRRWSLVGLVVFIAGQVSLVLAGAIVATTANAWHNVGHFFTALSAAGLTGLLAAVATVLVAGGFAAVVAGVEDDQQGFKTPGDISVAVPARMKSSPSKAPESDHAHHIAGELDPGSLFLLDPLDQPVEHGKLRELGAPVFLPS